MTDRCVILVDRLKEGKSLPITEDFSPSYLDLVDQDISFGDVIHVTGSTYLAESHLIIQLTVEGVARLDCSICNEPANLEFCIKNFYITKLISEIKSAFYSFKEDLREAILLEIPAFAECNQGCCPSRKDMQHYLKQGSEKESESDIYYPFKELDPSIKK